MDSIKNKIFGTYKNMAEKLKSIPTDSKFFEQGIQTPDEFTDAGDLLNSACPTWVWREAPDAKHNQKHLDPKKQYLTTQVMSSKRIKEVFESIDSNVQEVDGWTVTTDTTQNTE